MILAIRKVFYISILFFIIQFFRKRFVLQNEGPCGKVHTRQNIVWHFSKKRPQREISHKATYFWVLFVHIFLVHIFLVHIFLAGAQWSLATAQWSLATAQWSLLRAQESKNTRKKSDYACFGSWWVQIGSRSRRWDLYRLIVWI